MIDTSTSTRELASELLLEELPLPLRLHSPKFSRTFLTFPSLCFCVETRSHVSCFPQLSLSFRGMRWRYAYEVCVWGMSVRRCDMFCGLCWRMLTYDDVWWRMLLTYADVCWPMLTANRSGHWREEKKYPWKQTFSLGFVYSAANKTNKWGKMWNIITKP
jgi:hypothetical protein